LAITTAAFLPNTSKAPSNTERLVEPTSTKSPTTYIDTTANGVDLINIANPNSVGVSINHTGLNFADWLMLQKCIAVLLLFTLKRVIWGQMIKKLKIVFISLNIFTSLIVMADINNDIQRKQAQDRQQLELKKSLKERFKLKTKQQVMPKPICKI
jgi:hypothetical protein